MAAAVATVDLPEPMMATPHMEPNDTQTTEGSDPCCELGDECESTSKGSWWTLRGAVAVAGFVGIVLVILATHRTSHHADVAHRSHHRSANPVISVQNSVDPDPPKKQGEAKAVCANLVDSLSCGVAFCGCKWEEAVSEAVLRFAKCVPKQRDCQYPDDRTATTNGLT
jgi:hypothetical protein